MPQIFSKDPDDIMDYSIDFTSWLQSTENISSVDWSLDDDLTFVTHAFTNKIATVWVSGGVSGNRYSAKCKIVTNSTPIARNKVARIYFNIGER